MKLQMMRVGGIFQSLVQNDTRFLSVSTQHTMFHMERKLFIVMCASLSGVAES